MTEFQAALASALGGGRVRSEVPLAEYTTFRVGGPAEWLVETHASDEIVHVLAVAHEHRVPVTMLGGGSNVLVADTGVRGLVIRPRGGAIHRVDEARIRADAGITINGLVRWTVLHGIGGLEAWAGTPGTVGGAIYGNAHFGGRLIGELVVSAALAARDGRVQVVTVADMGFAYDWSRLQATREVLLSVDFRVHDGEAAMLRETARRSLAFRKHTQPLAAPSAGCIFRNPEPDRDRLPEGIPWSAGALVDRAGLKGFRIGGASVSATHANFIVNEGHATAADIRRLIEHCRAVVRERIGVELRDEIVYLGEFDAPPFSA
jgi:UDP-N-acetylmuramate dehydrogenase